MKKILFYLLFPFLFCNFMYRHDSSIAMEGTAELLKADLWRIQHEYADQDGVFVEVSRECDIDNTWNFQTDSTLLLGFGDQLCDHEQMPGETVAVSWRLEENNKYLVLNFQFDEVKFFIETISQHEIVLVLVNSENTSPSVYKIILGR